MRQHYPAFRELRSGVGKPLPEYVQEEFEAYLKCGRLEEGFLRVRCEECHAEKLVAFSCKKRGFCPSCGGRRMAETAALLADEVLPERPLRQWVLSLPHALRFLLATDPDALTLVLGVVYRTISRYLINQAGRSARSEHKARCANRSARERRFEFPIRREALQSAGLPAPVAALLADNDAGASQDGLYDERRTLSRLIGRPTTPFAQTIAESLSTATGQDSAS